MVGTALQTISLSLDISAASSVAKWLTAPVDGKEAAWIVVAALNAVGRGIIPMTWITYWLAFGLLSIGMIRSAVYPRWFGWVGLALSCPVVAVGIIHVFNARTTTITLAFVAFALLTNLWTLAVGIWVARKAW